MTSASPRSIRFREAHPDDRAALLEVATRAFAEVERSIDAVLGEPLDRLVTPSWAAHHAAVVQSALDNDDVTMLVAQDPHLGVVGFVAWRVHPASDTMHAYGEVEVIAVDPATRRRGIGRALLDHTVADLHERQVRAIMLGTGGDPGHAPARALYDAAGFTALPTVQYWLAGDMPSSEP